MFKFLKFIHIINFLAVEKNSPSIVKRDTGLTHEQFDDLLNSLPSLQNAYRCHTKSSDSLYMYLMKMRTGVPNEDIGNYFSLNKMTIGRRIKEARQALEKDFAMKYVNFVPKREDLISESTVLCQTIFCQNENKAVLICDGTYIFVNKSRNYEFQKATYTDQKKRNFIKVMMYITPNGTIVYALGPFPAVDNDAKILKKIDEESRALSTLHRGDILMLDRGFRDCQEYFVNKGFDVKMPSLVQKSSKNGQLSTKDANETRLITANRFAVETRNGHLKTMFKVFNMVWGSLSIPHLMVDVKICTALINRYHKTFEPNKGIAKEIGLRMLRRVNIQNDLAKIVNTNNFTRNLKKFELFDDFDTLPSLDGLNLIYIALGKYQIKQAESYCSRHMKDCDGRFNVFAFPNDLCKSFFESKFPNRNLKLLLIQIKSRYRSQKHYNAFILVDLCGQKENAVLGYCCECYNGLRTVGCCSHVMCLIWFTLYSKYRKIPNPAGFLDNYFGQDIGVVDHNFDEAYLDEMDMEEESWTQYIDRLTAISD